MVLTHSIMFVSRTHHWEKKCPKSIVSMCILYHMRERNVESRFHLLQSRNSSLDFIIAGIKYPSRLFPSLCFKSLLTTQVFELYFPVILISGKDVLYSGYDSTQTAHLLERDCIYWRTRCWSMILVDNSEHGNVEIAQQFLRTLRGQEFKPSVWEDWYH